MNKFLFTIPLERTEVKVTIESNDMQTAISKYCLVFGDSSFVNVESVIKI